MKKLCGIFLAALLLTACGRQETMETVADELVEPAMAQPRQVSVHLPEEAVSPVLENGSSQVYIGSDYEIMVETMSAGDLSETVRSLTGYEKEDLTVMETDQEGFRRYDFVWASAGETGERLGRAVILDDGSYHYCLSVLRDAAEKKSQIVWSDVFDSFTLV